MMSLDLYECGFCFTRQKLPYKYRDQPEFPCKNCGISVSVLPESLPVDQVQDIKAVIYQAGSQHKIDFGGPWGIPWPIFILIAIHHLVLLYEVYSFITEFAAQPNLVVEIFLTRVPQIAGLFLTVCGFHFRWQWFWSCIRTVLIITAVSSTVATAFTFVGVMLNNNMGQNQLEILTYFFVSVIICGLSYIEYYALGLTSTRAYFGFACPSCNSLLTRISFLNTDDASCLACKLNWKLSHPPKVKELHLVDTPME